MRHLHHGSHHRRAMMFKPWSRLIQRVDGPCPWIDVDRLQPGPAIIVKRVSAERYRLTVEYLARFSKLAPITPDRYESPLLDQIVDTMVNLAFLNRHSNPEEGFVEPMRWRKQ